MTVTLLVKDAIERKDGVKIPIPYDQTLKNTEHYSKYVPQYQGYNLAWYFYDFEKKFHTDDIRGNALGIVDPADVYHASEKITSDVRKEFPDYLPDSPEMLYNIFFIKFKKDKEMVRSIIDKLKLMLTDPNNSQKDKILSVIDVAEALYDKDEISNVWQILRENPIDGIDLSIQNPHVEKMRLLQKYVSLAYFFEYVGRKGHPIQWIVK